MAIDTYVITTAKEAAAAMAWSYCQNGHFAKPYKSGQCSECTRARHREMRALRAGVWNATRRAKYAAETEPEKLVRYTKTKAWRDANKDKLKAQRQTDYVTHKEVRSRKAKERRTRDAEKISAYFRKHYYGLTQDRYEQMLREQDGKCAICKSEQKLNVDHNHATGMVRGLLCGHCNRGLGFFSDSPDTMQSAITYLRDRP